MTQQQAVDLAASMHKELALSRYTFAFFLIYFSFFFSSPLMPQACTRSLRSQGTFFFLFLPLLCLKHAHGAFCLGLFLFSLFDFFFKIASSSLIFCLAAQRGSSHTACAVSALLFFPIFIFFPYFFLFSLLAARIQSYCLCC